MLGMDMSSLQTGLPRPAIDPANVAFKEAALKLTTLYKASQQSRHEGYIDAIDEVWSRFLHHDEVDIDKMKVWINDRRRKEAVSADTSEDAEMAAAMQQSDVLDAFDTEPVVASSPVETPRRVRLESPGRRHLRSDVGEARESAAAEQRRDRNGVKRRVIGSADIVPDLHKRGRFG